MTTTDRGAAYTSPYGPLTLQQMQAGAYAQSHASGFHAFQDQLEALLEQAGRCEMLPELRAVFALSKIALIHSELSEAVEEIRAGRYINETRYREDGKPEGVPSELADAIIRIGDFAGAPGHRIDLNAIIAEKMAFNATREHKHGKVL